MELLLLFPWATDRLAEIGLKTFIGLSVTGIFLLVSKGEYEGIIPLVIVSYILSWGFAHTGYVLIIAALWLWRSIPRLITSIIQQREAAYLTPQRDIAGRDLYSLLTIKKPVIEPQETLLEFLQRAQAEEANITSHRHARHVINAASAPLEQPYQF